MSKLHPFSHPKKMPNSKYHQPDARYIRSLVTRAKVVNSVGREEVAKLCGISLITLNRYRSYSKTAVKCPYAVQFTLEKLAGLNCDGCLYEVKCNTKPNDPYVLSDYDVYIKVYDDSALEGNDDVSVVIAMAEDEVKLMADFLTPIANNVSVRRLDFDDWV